MKKREGNNNKKQGEREKKKGVGWRRHPFILRLYKEKERGEKMKREKKIIIITSPQNKKKPETKSIFLS
jgi:hypothetical protein